MNKRMLKTVKLHPPGWLVGDTVRLEFNLHLYNTGHHIECALLGKDEFVCRIRGDGTLEMFLREWV